jgi:hypothetical protein
MWALLFASVVEAGCVSKLGDTYYYAEVGQSAITKGGDLYFWGDNEYFAATGDFTLVPPIGGPPPFDTVSSAMFPIEQTGVDDVTWFTGGDTHQCGLWGNGSAFCWGHDDGSGKVGFGATAAMDYNTPMPITNAGPFADIAAGDDTTCVISSSDWTVWCLGDGSQHMAVDGTSSSIVRVWTKVPFISNAVGIVAGGSTNYAWSSTGAVWAWGQNDNGQLASSSPSDGYNSISVPGAVGCGVGADHACCWTSSMLLCWGLNADGQVGVNSYVQINTPTPVMLPGTPMKADGGDAHTCAINTQNTLYCWGANGVGQLGLRDEIERNKPTLPTMYNVVDVNCDFESTCALTKGGDVFCFGFLSPLSATFLSNTGDAFVLEPVRYPDETFDCSEAASKKKNDKGKKARKVGKAAGLIGVVGGVAAIGLAVRYRRKKNYQALATSASALPAV